MFFAIGVEVHDARGASRTIDLNLANVGVRANLAVAGRFRLADHRCERARLRSVLAPISLAEAAMLTRHATTMRSRENCHWRGEWMIPELARRCLEEDT